MWECDSDYSIKKVNTVLDLGVVIDSKAFKILEFIKRTAVDFNNLHSIARIILINKIKYK